MQKFRENSGFTLVEMITTMTILSVLAVFSIKPMGNFVGQARQAEAKNTLAHISSSQTSYAIANSTYQSIPSYGGGDGTCSGTNSACAGNITTESACTSAHASCSWAATGSTNCDGEGWLHLQGCKHMRYHYQIQGDSQGHYAIAKTNGDNLVFGCTITGGSQHKITGGGKNGEGTRYSNGGDVTAYAGGSTDKTDTHYITEEQGLTTAFDAVANCD